MEPGASSYRDLYYAWEREQWSAGALDLEPDRSSWSGIDPALKDRIEEVLATSRSLAERTLELLVPLVDAAPTEEQQVFLTTQLADAARHAVFFDLAVALTGRERDGSRQDPWPDLADKARALHLEPTHPQLLREAVALQLSVEEDVVGRQRELLAELERRSVLPGLRAGLTHVIRDATRHAEFGRSFLAEIEKGLGTKAR